MKVTFFLCALALGAAMIAAPQTGHASATTFLKEVDDLPLAPGLVELPGGTLFEEPEGRIVEASARGDLMEVVARQFYDESLPQLGWTQIGSSTYERDKERLHISYSEGMPMTVHFSLTPIASAGGKDQDKSKDTETPGDQDQNPSQPKDEGGRK